MSPERGRPGVGMRASPQDRAFRSRMKLVGACAGIQVREDSRRAICQSNEIETDLGGCFARMCEKWEKRYMTHGREATVEPAHGGTITGDESQRDDRHKDCLHRTPNDEMPGKKKEGEKGKAEERDGVMD